MTADLEGRGELLVGDVAAPVLGDDRRVDDRTDRGRVEREAQLRPCEAGDVEAEVEVGLELPHGVEIKPDGTMPYVNLRVPTGFTQDKWIRAWEVLPTARAQVHHVLVFAVPEGAKGPMAEAHGFFAAYVPGGGFRQYDATRAKKLPKGSDLLSQLH